MAKKRLIVVHGMGQHSDASVKEEIVGAFTKAFSLYDSLKGKSVEEHFDIIPVVYNQFFDDYRAQLANHSSGIANRVAEIDGSLPLSAQAVQEINDIEASIGTDGVALHFRSVCSLGYTKHSGSDGFFVSFDLLKLLQNKQRVIEQFQP
jgi:hypothetical protein